MIKQTMEAASTAARAAREEERAELVRAALDEIASEWPAVAAQGGAAAAEGYAAILRAMVVGGLLAAADCWRSGVDPQDGSAKPGG